MGLHSDSNMSIPAMLCSPLSLSSPYPILVKHSLKTWNQFRRYFKFHDFSCLSPIALNHLFKPSVQDGVFLEWHRSGLTHFKDIFIEKKLASFIQQLSNKYGLPQSHFFRYLQARNIIQSHLSGSASFPEHTSLETILLLNPTCFMAL